MTSKPLDIKVVYDANARGRRRAPAAAAAPKPSGKRRGPSTASLRPRGRVNRGLTLTLSLLTLLLAGGFYYFTWWQADPELYLRMATKTPIPGVDLDMLAAGMFGGPLPDGGETVPAEEDAGPPPAIAPETATYVIPASVYTWLALATIAAFFLAVCAGGGLRTSSGGSLMLPGVLAVLVVLGVCGWYASKHGMSLPKEPRVIRTSMGLVPLFGLGLGMLLVRNARRWAKVAAVALILSAIVTAAGLQLGNMTAAFDAEQVTPLVIAAAFIGHSLWGWVLLFGSRRFPA